jgi:antitoxin VapB
VRIPRELELPGDEVFIRAEKGTLILEPVSPGRGLLRLLAKWKPIADAFPDVAARTERQPERPARAP